MIEDNVERLSVRPVAPRVVLMGGGDASSTPSIDLSAVVAAVQQATVETHKQVLQAIPHVAQQAVNAALKATHSTVIGTFQTIATILAVRFILLLAVIGGFALAVMVMQSPTLTGAAILGGYVVSTIWPLVWLFGKAPGASGTTSTTV